MLEVLLHRCHPLMSLDCPLAIRHKKGKCIVIRGDEELCFLIYLFFIFYFLCRLYFRGSYEICILF